MPKPDNVGVGVAIVVRRPNGEILLLKRKGAHASGKWACPGGWIDDTDESPEATCFRELREEVGIFINPSELKPLINVSEWHEELQMRTVTLYYIVEYDVDNRGEPKILEPEKCSRMKWTSVEIALAFPDVLFPKLEQALKVLSKYSVSD